MAMAVTERKRTVQSMITFPQNLYRLVEMRAKRYGMLVPEYIRFLALDDIRDEADKVEILDEKTSREVGKALKDIKEGRVSRVLKNEDDIDSYFDELSVK